MHIWNKQLVTDWMPSGVSSFLLSYENMAFFVLLLSFSGPHLKKKMKHQDSNKKNECFFVAWCFSLRNPKKINVHINKVDTERGPPESFPPGLRNPWRIHGRICRFTYVKTINLAAKSNEIYPIWMVWGFLRCFLGWAFGFLLVPLWVLKKKAIQRRMYIFTLTKMFIYIYIRIILVGGFNPSEKY